MSRRRCPTTCRSSPTRRSSCPGTECDNAPEGAVALPVRAHGRELGHFVLTFARPTYGVSVPPDAKHAAVALADQLGMALLRFRRP